VDDLNSRELEIMKILWDDGALKPVQIQERLERPVKNSSLRWQLAALVEKGLVVRRRRGKAFFYKAQEAKENVFASLVGRMTDVFSGGSALALVGRILETKADLSEEDVQELIALARNRSASQAESDPPNRKGASS
jgi:BlaI family penicillinase repressor